MNMAFRQCVCSAEAAPEPDENVCPEDRNESTRMCNQQECGNSIPPHEGICNIRTYIDGQSYRYCACCPPDKKLGCDACGGDVGGGHCKGIEEYMGMRYTNCSCVPGGGSV